MYREHKPVGRQEVMSALVDATIELIVEEGLEISVRQIAARATVNHGLVHLYFGSKQCLLSTAIDEINTRAGEDLDADGFPRPDLASRRNGELAKALARIRLDAGRDLFTTHPITGSWRRALRRSDQALTDDEISTKIATAAALGLGWALYADHLCELLDIDPEQRVRTEAEVHALVADLGGLPTWDGSSATSIDRPGRP